MNVQITHWFVAALIGAGAALIASTVLAEDRDLVAEVVHGHDAPVKVADDGDARVVAMARGTTGHLAEFRLDPGADFEPAVRQQEVYLYALRGSAVINVQGRRHLIGPRTGVYVPAGAEVRWTNGSEEFVAVQALSGNGSVEAFEDWRVDEPSDWPRPRTWPTPDPAEISGR